MQKIDYRYNVRGWLTQINDAGLGSLYTEGDKFGMKIGYNRLPNGNASNMRNGNIAGIDWSSFHYKNKGVRYNYDNCNRLTSSNHYEAGTAVGKFNTDYSYNKNGNFSTTLRLGSNSTPIDQISFGYETNSNRLKYALDYSGDVDDVDDFPGSFLNTAQHFFYDANGNLTRDDYRSVNISYNQLNLPDLMDFGGNNKIYYFYTPRGQKLSTYVEHANGDRYLDNYNGQFVYRIECDALFCSSYLKYIVTPEGRIVNNGDDYNPSLSWEYNLKDHLGNTRVVVKPATNPGYATVLQETNYFPFGMRISQLCSTFVASTDNRYLYNGKELQDDFGLNWGVYPAVGGNYGARFYDPALGRWHSVDPMAELYDSYSPYNYALNNPILFLDPNGMWVATAGGYSTDDPEEIARFLSYKKAENAVNNINPDVDQMTGFIEGEMNGGGKLSDGSHLISDITTTKQGNGSWKVNQESLHKAWVDVHKIQSGEIFHILPVEGEPVMRPLESWYAKAWHGMNGGRNYNGHEVNSQGLITGNMVLITGMAPTPGKAGNAIKWAKVMSGKDVVKMLKKNGFKVTAQEGSHLKLTYMLNGRSASVPVHGSKDLPIGTLKNIMKQVTDCLK